MKMKISIVIPVFNDYKLLEELMLSITNKELRNISLQVVIVDDGSTCNIADELSHLVEAFISCDIDLIFLRQDNLGPGGARNSGLKAVTGDYIWFSDADDYIVNECFQSFLKAVPFDILEFGYFDESRNKLFIPQCKDTNKTLEYLRVSDGRFYLWNKIFNKKVLEGQIFNTELLSLEDYCFCTNIFLKDFDISYSDKCFYRYRLNSKSITKDIDINKMKRLSKDTIIVHKFLMDLKSEQVDCYKKGIIDRLLDISIAGYIYSLYVNKYDKSYYKEAFDFYASNNKKYFRFFKVKNKKIILLLFLFNIASIFFRARKKIIG